MVFFEKVTCTMQLYLHDTDTYKEEALKLCHKLYQIIGYDEDNQRYDIIHKIAEQFNYERNTVATNNTAKIPIENISAVIDVTKLLIDIAQLNNAIQHIIEYTVPKLEQICIKKTTFLEYVQALNKEVQQFRSIMNYQQKHLIEWNNTTLKEADDVYILNRAVTVTEQTMNELNKLMKHLTI
ncbi:hypothetical protein GJ496_010508 [Pomphorhynchus laevis]|nr:hypothetical protein GJ496_010508 [Pomphorhynchus laevis]